VLADQHQADALLRAVKMPKLEKGVMKTAEQVGCRLRARALLAWQRPCHPVWLCSAGAVCTLAALRPLQAGTSMQAAWQALPPEKYSWLLKNTERLTKHKYPNAARLVQPSDAAQRADAKAAESKKRAGGENAAPGGSKRAAGSGTARGSVLGSTQAS
jgi:hypothetical protein